MYSCFLALGFFGCSRWRSPPADLLHEREKIADSPVFGDLAVAHSHHVDAFKMNFAMSWRNAEKRSFMRAVIRFVCRHPVAIGQLPMDLRMKVGKSLRI